MRYALPLALMALLVGAPAFAADAPNFDLTIKDHRFTPAEIHVPARTQVILTIRNQDATAEEFDSSALKTEKVIAGNESGMVHLRPLAPGRYPFMGEYHSATAQGVVVAE